MFAQYSASLPSAMHGLVSQGIAGNFASMGIDPGQVFEAQLAALTA